MIRERKRNPWINPQPAEFKLVRTAETKASLDRSWDQIEESQLAERVGRTAAEINEAAGYHLLEMLFFLPPHKNVLRVRFDRNRSKHSLEIRIRDNEIRLTFSTYKRLLFRLDRYFSSERSGGNSNVVWEQAIHPEEISEEHIQGWLTYLLSELNKEFRPDLFAPSPAGMESDLSALLRKISA